MYDKSLCLEEDLEEKISIVEQWSLEIDPKNGTRAIFVPLLFTDAGFCRLRRGLRWSFD